MIKKENRISLESPGPLKKCEVHGTPPQPTPMLSLIPFIPIPLSLILFSTRLLQDLLQLNRSFSSLTPFQRTHFLSLMSWINLLSPTFIFFPSLPKNLRYCIPKIYLNSTPLWFFSYLCLFLFLQRLPLNKYRYFRIHLNFQNTMIWKKWIIISDILFFGLHPTN